MKKYTKPSIKKAVGTEVTCYKPRTYTKPSIKKAVGTEVTCYKPAQTK